MAQVVGRHGIVAEGIFATASGHTLTQPQREKPHLDFNDFFVDIGAKSRSAVEERRHPCRRGRYLSWSARRFGTRIAGKAMDDRMLLAIMNLLLDDLDCTTLQYDRRLL